MGKNMILAVFVALTAVIFTAASVVPAFAQDDCDRDDKPDRAFSANLVYPGVTIGPDEKVRVDYKVINKGRSEETLTFEILEKPEGWQAHIKAFGDEVSGFFLPEGENRSLTLAAFPNKEDDKLPIGKFTFKVKATTADGMMSQTSSVVVTVRQAEKSDEGVSLTTSYPFLRGPSDSKFEFSLDIKNDTDEDSLFNFSAVLPEGWEGSFKPSYEDKQINSIQVKANQSNSVAFSVTPPLKADAGRYEFLVKVGTAKVQGEVPLSVELTGTYSIKTGTPDGLLSLTTQKGQTGNISLFVKNEGSAAQREVTFLTFKPENWKVEYKPEKIENLKAGEIKQVEVSITPAEQALVGDYSVAVSAEGEKTSDEVEFRVTVNASSAWGWIGVAIIVLVIIFLAVMFKTLGRR